jgi:hypothetical protein
MPETSEDDEVRRALKLLEALVKAHGLTKKALDQKLRKGPGYISQVLTGRLGLKYHHILEILGALELDPGLFFRALFLEPEKPTGSDRMMERFLESLQKMGYYGERPFPAAALSAAASPAVPPAGAVPAGPAGAVAAAPRAIDSDDLDRRIRSGIREALAERGGQRPGPPGGEIRLQGRGEGNQGEGDGRSEPAGERHSEPSGNNRRN